MPQKAKSLLLNSSLCSENILNCEPSLQRTFQRFIRSRAINYEGKSVLAPIWELVNHSPFEKPFKTSKNGIETPAYQTNPTTHEIVHPYKKNASPLHIFFNYGFASNEPLAYSLPVKIQLSDRSLTITIKGIQRGIRITKRVYYRPKVHFQSRHFRWDHFQANYRRLFSIQSSKNME